MSEKDEEDYRSEIIFRVSEKGKIVDIVGDPCCLTVKYRGPAKSNCNIKVTQKQSNFVPFVFHNFEKYDCPLFLKNWMKKRMMK